MGSASTWSLDRLDALAAEASALFQQRSCLGMPLRDLKSQAVNLRPKPSRRSSSVLGAKLPVTSGAAVVGSGGSREGGNEKNATEALSADRNRKRRKPSKQAPAAQTASDGAALREASQPRSRKSVDALQKEPSLMPKPSKQQGVAARGGSKKPAEMAHSSVASADWKRPGKTVAKSSGTQQANVQVSVQGASTSAAGGSGAS